MATPRLALELIVPGDVHTNRFMVGIMKLMDEELELAQRAFDRFTNTWDHQPTWRKIITVLSGDLAAEIYTLSDIFIYVAEGTKKRHAVMGPTKSSYQRKTRPRVLVSKAGGVMAPGFPFVSRKITLPGVKAREPHWEIAKRRQRPFRLKFRKVLVKQSNRIFGNRRVKNRIFL